MHMVQNQPAPQPTAPQQPAPHPIAPGHNPPHRPLRGSRRKREGWSSIASTVAVLLIAPLVALFLTSFVFQSYQVDGPSMQTTLYNNDRLLVWKVPKTWSRITGNSYIPKRGDVIIFIEGNMSGQDKQLIKRVVALPGERVVVKDGVVMVYNNENSDGFEPDSTLPYGEELGAQTTNGEVDLVVPKNHVYVLGDNRGDSLDSRSFGPVAADDIVGKLILRVWPAGDMKAF
jgi:signal peptidase I